jgi:Cu/Zn superoxide dismutase
MRYLFTNILLFLIVFGAVSQNRIGRYAYWFNNEHQEVITQNTAPVDAVFNLNTQVAVDHLPEGLHAFHIRFQDNEGRWSSTLSRFFYRMPTVAHIENNIQEYQYWFNNNFQDAVVESAGNTKTTTLNKAVDTNSLPPGLHVFHIRFRDASGQWSSTMSRFFYKRATASLSENDIQEYQYWFNNDFANAVAQNASGTKTFNLNHEMDANDLPDGLHAFHIRFKDNRGQWSSTMSRFFYKLPVKSQSANSMQEYQYWFNNDMDNAMTLSAGGTAVLNLNSAVDASELPNGLQTFHIRFRDNNGHWSSTLSKFFYKMPEKAVTENLVTGYEYWFDENEEVFGETLNEPVNPLHLMAEIETPYLEVGEHALNIRFLDLQEQWSVVTTDTFMVENCEPRPLNNLQGAIEACQSTATLFSVEAALNITNIDWSVSPAEAGIITGNYDQATIAWNEAFTGEAIVSAQGSNPCGTTEARNMTINILPLPAVTAMDDLAICEGEQVELSIESSIGLTEWDVAELTFIPASTATYTVTAENECGSVSDQVTVTVNPYPTLNIMKDVEICNGTSVELTAESNDEVVWEHGSSTVTPTETTTYTATATSNNCSVEGNVTVIVNPVYEFSEEEQICFGESFSWHENEYTEAGQYTENYFTESGCDSTYMLNLSIDSIDATVTQDGETLSANEADAVYQWVDCDNNDAPIEGATNRIFEAEASGNFAVIITSENCNAISDCYQVLVTEIKEKEGNPQITVFPNPVKKELYIRLGAYMEGFSLSLFDSGGKQVRNRENISGTEVSFNVSSLKKGTYILEIVWEDNKWHRKIVVQD